MVRGSRVGQFAIDSLLAEGGFGLVYRAHAADGTTVALKVLVDELAATAEAISRFEREVSAIQRIAHPNVVKILAVGTLPDRRPYYAMELLTGQDLERRIAERGRLSPCDLVALLGPVTSALDAAHAVGVVHRDVKASNIFVTEDGRVVLLDFGVAKLSDAPALTLSRQVIGSASAMSPEQFEGGAVDARTDVYALGALAYHALIGAPPFAGESADVACHMHRFARRPRPSALCACEPGIDTVVVRAMSIRPADRYRSPGEMMAALRDAVASADTDTRPARALAVHIHVDSFVVGDDDPIPPLVGILERQGFVVVMSGSWSALLVRELEAFTHPGLATKLRAIAPPGVEITTRIGNAMFASGRPTGGELLDLGGWGMTW